MPFFTLNLTRADIAARILAVILGLNINGLIALLFNVGQSFSLVILATTLYLLATNPLRLHINSAPTVLLVTAIIVYLILGTLFCIPIKSANEIEIYLFAYVNSILIIIALAGYSASLVSLSKIQSFMVFLRNIFIVAGISVLMSPWLYTLYVNLPPSADQRMGGFFGNPNEGALASVMAIALFIAVPVPRRWLQILLVMMLSVAVILTFSKASISMLVVILLWNLLHLTKGLAPILRLCLAIATILAGFTFIQYIPSGFRVIVESPALDLSLSQQKRILAIPMILSGQIDEKTSTGRTYMWNLVLSKAWDEFPLGSGLGSNHHIIGGIIEDGVWQGAHNTFLMILGEAGPLPSSLLVGSFLILTMTLVRSRQGVILLPILFVLFIDMMTTHGALVARYHNLMLGVILGLTANRTLTISRIRATMATGRKSGRLGKRAGL